MNTAPEHLQNPENLFVAIAQRHSVRAFKPDPIPSEVIEEALQAANQAPSNCNVQPWRILVASGAARDRIRNQLVALASSGVKPNPDFGGGNYADIPLYRRRQVDCAVTMYNRMDITRDDTEGRIRAALRNFELFDAPHVAFFCMHRQFGTIVAVDMGMAAQNFMLTLTSRGVGTCAQGSMRQYPDLIRREFNEPEEMGVLFGMSFGYEDTGAAVNATDPGRAPIEDNSRLLEN